MGPFQTQIHDFHQIQNPEIHISELPDFWKNVYLSGRYFAKRCAPRQVIQDSIDKASGATLFKTHSISIYGPLSSGYLVLNLRSWSQNPGTKFLVPRSWYQDLGTKILVPGSWYQDLWGNRSLHDGGTALSHHPNRYPFVTVRTPQASLVGEKSSGTTDFGSHFWISCWWK